LSLQDRADTHRNGGAESKKGNGWWEILDFIFLPAKAAKDGSKSLILRYGTGRVEGGRRAMIGTQSLYLSYQIVLTLNYEPFLSS
jgi:hypothetical protein